MKAIVFGIALAATAAAGPGGRRANFLHISVTAASGVKARAIWRPYAGAIGATVDEQQAALRARRVIGRADSVRHWEDPTARDSILVNAPAEFVVDMNGGPIVIEAVGHDSIRVEAQLTPARGPVVAVWGSALVIESDGRTPFVDRRR